MLISLPIITQLLSFYVYEILQLKRLRGLFYFSFIYFQKEKKKFSFQVFILINNKYLFTLNNITFFRLSTWSLVFGVCTGV